MPDSNPITTNEVIYKKAVVEFQMAREIAGLFNRNNELREETLKASTKLVTILKYLTEFALSGNHYDDRGIDKNTLDKFRSNARSTYFINYRNPSIPNGILHTVIRSQIFAEIELNYNTFFLFNSIVSSKELLDSRLLGTQEAIICKVISFIVNKFDPVGPPVPGTLVTVGEIGELFSIFANISTRIKKLEKIGGLDYKSLPIGIGEFLEIIKMAPEYRASKDYQSWKKMAFDSEHRRREGPNTTAVNPVFLRLADRFNVTEYRKRGMGRFNLRQDSVLFRMNEMFGLVHGADISGSAGNHAFVIETMFRHDFKLNDKITLPKAETFCYDPDNKCFDFNPYIVFICFATLVAEFHHTVLEVALALSLNWEGTISINYSPGIYSSLAPINSSVKSSKNSAWVDEMHAILSKAEEHVDNKLMLVGNNKSDCYIIEGGIFRKSYVINHDMYSSFAARYPLNGIYDHNILLNRLLKNGTELYEMKDRRDREAAAMEMRAQRGRWLLGYPNSVKAMEFDDPDAYWYKMDWAKINFNEQLQWQALGWNQNNWIGNAPTPASEFKTWLSLSVDEIAAAESLGYNYYTWKGTKVVINKAEYGLLKEPNKKIDVTLRLQILVNYGSLTVYVDNFMAGYDPAPSRGKQLNVKYTLVGGKNMEKTVNESETIRFDDMVV